jgi:hypothetical protein
MFGVTSAEELAALSAETVMLRLLDSIPVELVVPLGQERAREVLGHVAEDEDTAHVLFRTRWTRDPALFFPMPTESFEVTTVVREGETWRVARNELLDGLRLLLDWQLPEEGDF